MRRRTGSPSGRTFANRTSGTGKIAVRAWRGAGVIRAGAPLISLGPGALPPENVSGELAEVLRQHPVPGGPLVRPLRAPVVHPVGYPLGPQDLCHPPGLADVLPVALPGR